MAARPVLVDSSYYIRLAREGRDPLRELAVVAAQRDLVVCGVVRCEVSRGLRSKSRLKAFQRAWDVMRFVPTDHRLWIEAEHTLWELDRSGVVLPLTDVVIACCARRVDGLVLTFDQHFEAIPGIRAVSEIL
jgi:predicted nucleic acid-binding protein